MSDKGIDTLNFYERSKHIMEMLDADFPARATIGEKMWMWSTAENLPRGSVWIEIGTFEGWSAKIVATANPCVHVLTIDPKNTSRRRKLARVFGDAKNIHPITAMSVCGHDGDTTIRHVRKRLEEIGAVSSFVDVVYIDGDHSVDGATADMTHYAKIVKPGGLLAGHDYNWIRRRMRRRSSRTTKAVTDWFAREGRTIHNTERVWWAVI